MRRAGRRWALFALVGAAAASLGGLATTAHAQAGAGKGKEKEKAKDAQPMTAADSAADAAKKEAQRVERMAKANTRALFAATEPIEFTLIANYNAISRDRDTLSTKRFPGTLIVTDSAGAERRIPVRLRTRGHFRLMARNCRFVPLRVDFPDSGLKGTPFAGQKGLKLGTHCQNGDDRYDTYTRKEYLAYRLFNVVTPRSFRARLANATYVDSASGKPVATRTALFIENEDELAARLGGKIRDWRGALFDDIEANQLLDVSLFQYAIGNTDWSIYALHNIRIGHLVDGSVLALAYDFDFSGLVGAHYATPDPKMGIRTVRERKFRGPCRSLEEYQASAQRFLARKDAMLAEVAAVPGMERDDQRAATDYLREFFETIGDRRRLKGEIVDNCEGKPGM